MTSPAMARQPNTKRKFASSGPQRRVRARMEEDVELSSVSGSSQSDGDEHEPSDSGSSGNSEESELDSDEESESGNGRPTKPAATADMSRVSFGALAKAQASLGASGRRKARDDVEEDENPHGRRRLRDAESDSDGERDSKRARSGPASRVSKHAPTEMSSKRPVSRRREIVAVPKIQHRDPRFDATMGSSTPQDEARARKAYSFLNEYRDSEMVALRAEAKKTKDPAQKERLKRLLLSMESKKKAAERKDTERRVLEEHRQREKELVEQGKKPFYLKKSEQKKRLLTEQFKNMKKKQVDRVIERKRKKVAGREKKELDHLQRRG